MIGLRNLTIKLLGFSAQRLVLFCAIRRLAFGRSPVFLDQFPQLADSEAGSFGTVTGASRVPKYLLCQTFPESILSLAARFKQKHNIEYPANNR
jgi:hypothetical protein